MVILVLVNRPVTTFGPAVGLSFQEQFVLVLLLLRDPCLHESFWVADRSAIACGTLPASDFCKLRSCLRVVGVLKNSLMLCNGLPRLWNRGPIWDPALSFKLQRLLYCVVGASLGLHLGLSSDGVLLVFGVDSLRRDFSVGKEVRVA